MASILDISWLMTLLVVLVTLFLMRSYLKLRNLPPGPFPWPVVGNLLSFRIRPASDVIHDFRKKYGDIFTVWMGSMPFVMVTSLPHIKEALLDRRNDYAGRPHFTTMENFTGGNESISFSDFGKPWEVLRKMGHVAARKYAVSDKLPPLIEDIANEIGDKMLQEKTPFNPKDYMRLLISNIIASSIFGQRFESDDPEFLAFKSVSEVLQKDFANGSPVDILPILRPFYRGTERRIQNVFQEVISRLSKKVQNHIATYQSGVIRDLIDSLLSAREDVIADGKESAMYMTDVNLTQVISDFYFASTETTQFTTRWMLLFLAEYPDMQEKVIQELREKLGNRTAVHEDLKMCPYIAAVISESLRLRPVAPYALPHKTMCNSQIGGHNIPKGTNVVFQLSAVHHDPEHWENPEIFNPDRFLETDGSSKDSRLSQYMPFGQGRRACIGEKLAIVEIFMIFANLFRKCRITLMERPKDMQPDENVALFSQPKDYKIQATQLND